MDTSTHRCCPPHGAWRGPALACALVAGLAGACADDPGAPAAPPGAGVMPLAVGDAWTYHHARVTRFLEPNGSDARTPIAFDARSRRTIIALEKIAGTSYAVQEESFFAIGSLDTSVTWRRYREDETGLYRADLPRSAPPGSLAGIDTVTETRELAYPLRVGATWELHAGNPSATATVEAVETVQVQGDVRRAFRVSLSEPGMRPSDARLFWYSSCGLLARHVHAELNALDTGTGQVLRIVSDEDVDPLDSRPRCARPAWPASPSFARGVSSGR